MLTKGDGVTTKSARVGAMRPATRLSRLVDELTEAAKRLGLEVRRERILREVGYRARGGGVPVA
jgi:hypothetical protein